MIRSAIAAAVDRGGVDEALRMVEAEVRARLEESPETDIYLHKLLTEFRPLALAYFEAAKRGGAYEPRVTFVMELDDLHGLKRVLLEHPRLSEGAGQQTEGNRRQARK